LKSYPHGFPLTPVPVITGVGVGTTGIGVGIAVGIGLGVGVGTSLGVGVGTSLGVGVGVGLGNGVAVGFTIGLGVTFAVDTDSCTTCCDVVFDDAPVCVALFVPAAMLERPEHNPHIKSKPTIDKHPTPSFVPFF
jgi:hypothetical protein